MKSRITLFCLCLTGVFHVSALPAEAGVVDLSPGTFSSCSFDSDGTSGDRTIYRADPPGSRICTGEVTVSGDYVTVHGVEFRGSSGSGVRIRGDHVTVEDCEVHDSGYNGFNISGVSDTTIQDCYIHHVGRSGIFADATAHNVTIRRNRFTNINISKVSGVAIGHGVYLKGTSEGQLLVEDNEFHGLQSKTNSISFRGPGIIRRNLVSGSGKNGIYLLDDTDIHPNSTVLVENNIVFGHRLAALRIGASTVGWNIAVRNNTLLGTTVGIYAQENWSSLSLHNNIVAATGPEDPNCDRPECRKPFALRLDTESGVTRSHNLYFVGDADFEISNRGLKPDEWVGDPGFPASASRPLDFLPGGDLVLDRGRAIAGLTEDHLGNPRPVDGDGNGSTQFDLGALEAGGAAGAPPAAESPPVDPIGVPAPLGPPGRPELVLP